MSAIVEYSFYTDTYKGQEPDVDASSFPALEAHAERIIGAMTRWRVTEETFPDLPHFTQTLVKLAICSQVDAIALNGFESVSAGNNVGFTVGKVLVDGGSKTSGTLSASVSPAAMLYLEQTGLLNPAVPVLEGYPC
ncbi:MAG: hypothetical protein IKE23_12810 [Exiguobacterium sp.]|nr:hypothetical protein [Exiguobacterium sp.]